MIGNDVIDLQEANKNANWERQRFLDKLFSENEKIQIFQNEKPQLIVWLFWSMKEAAYKANQRRFNLKRRYNPKDFECSLIEFNEKASKSIVSIGGEQYCCSSFFNSEKIHTIASASEETERTFNVIEAASGEMKKDFFKRISEAKKLKSAVPQLRYNEHFIPQLFFDSEEIRIPFSFSHHGRFSAFAFSLNYS